MLFFDWRGLFGCGIWRQIRSGTACLSGASPANCSLLDGLPYIKDMVRRAAELDMPAVAVTDHGVMSGMVELSDACDAVKKETADRLS